MSAFKVVIFDSFVASLAAKEELNEVIDDLLIPPTTTSPNEPVEVIEESASGS